jgi:protein-S-isoprenylcysteine O-methyltransferase Ste14
MLKALENRIPPPIVMAVTGLAMWALSWGTPAVHIPTGIRCGLAGMLLVVSVSVAGLAISSFRRLGTTINPIEIDRASSLVTTGTYAFTRNPMYVGLTTLLVTLAVLLSNAWLLPGPLFFMLYITRFQIIPEERVMQEKFGSAYDAYKASVRRWL